MTNEEILRIAEPFGSFEYGDAQGDKRIAFARAIIAAYAKPIVEYMDSGPETNLRKCTAKIINRYGSITTASCRTGKPLIDAGESSDGEEDYYTCPDCGKFITVSYREN